MPGRSAYHALVSASFRRWPRLQALGLTATGVLARAALFPFRRRRLPGSTAERRDLLDRTDAFNAAAEHYFASATDTAFLLDKPFSDRDGFGRHLVNTGVLIQALQLRPGDIVAEIGAGTCWLSHLLNRFGCTTFAIDVSPTALALGRQLFERDPRTRWDLAPQFLAYDGHTLPLRDGSVDRIVISDAFHHVPNQCALLTEMCRVLKPDGALAMSEPGRGHGTAAQSLAEAEATGVLENELVLEDVAALAEACGFRDVSVVVASAGLQQEIPARALGEFMGGGRGFPAYWKALCTSLEQHHYIVCRPRAQRPTTRRPGVLAAEIHIESPGPAARVTAGGSISVRLSIANTGDTRWLCDDASGGWTRIGVRLYRDAQPREPVALDWHRAALPRDVEPGDTVSVTCQLPALDSPGSYVVAFDLVVEGLTWLADRGSRPASMAISVTA
jgi:SAM-dependent methyltransferase